MGTGPLIGASKVCTPEPEKVSGSVSVHSTAPGLTPLTSFSVITMWAPAVVLSLMLTKSKPMELSV